ncbi:MAG TPA: S8 family serine peptidase [Gaiellaceae bacterium]|nr:S8 family serine peptidase [Gaiellaceae bacterium]
MRSTPSPRRLAQLGLLAVVALAAAAISVAAATGGHSQTGRDDPVSWRGLVGGPRPEVPVGQRMIVVLRTPSLARRVAAAGGRASEATQRRWHTAVQAAQRQLIARLSVAGLQLRPEFTYSRVLSGFSAALDARAIALLQRFPEVEGVYPVRIAYPAATATQLVDGQELAAGSGVRASLGLPGYTGRGVTIALLDTGVQQSHDYLAGAVLEGADVLADDDLAAAAPRPDEPAERERHGTQMAGLVVGSGGPAGLSGVAENATILPIRVAGWQRDAAGRWAVYSRTDQLIAGLERAVDPNGDGSTLDAARIALVGVAEPYAAFADSPTARAVAGALALDTLVVAPAGNDGPAGPRYGSIAGPGGARDALTVGAADDRRSTESVRVTIRSGLRLIYDGEAPLGGAFTPNTSLALDLAGPAEREPLLPANVGGSPAPTVSIGDFFDRQGYSRVAGKAALVPAGEAPDAAAAAAARAGAGAVVLHDERIPAGSLGADERIGVPVVSVPAGAAHEVLRLLDAGEPATVEIGAPRARRNADVGGPAAFSSRGLAFDGGAKPEVLASGVGLLTSLPGRGADGQPAFGTVSGSSAAAAVVAGGAALLAQARPDLDARALRGALVGTAKTVHGGRRLDLGAAAAVEVVSEPSTVALGHANVRGWQGTAQFRVRNVSERPLTVDVSTGRLGEVGGAALAVSPVRFRLQPRAERKVYVVVRLAYLAPGVESLKADFELRAGGGAPIRVPWTLTLGRYERNLVGAVRLSANRFKPSDSAPVLLELRAGRLVQHDGRSEVLPLDYLDLELWRGRERIGRLARLRNLLPGRYTFGLTGRGPAGRRLSPGRYTLRLIGHPPGEGPPSRQFVQFTIR